jgi:hypothetical protein
MALTGRIRSQNTGYAVFISHFGPGIFAGTISVLVYGGIAAEPESPHRIDLSAEGYDDIH